jgi:Mlc titration factor MtfA (ptsG expression regulator)
LSGRNERIDDIEDIRKSVRRSTDPSVHSDAIHEIADLTKTRIGKARKTGVIAIAEIGKITPWSEQMRMAFEKISEIIQETNFS